jgi:ABC-type uncharacterized transport system permease subunit
VLWKTDKNYFLLAVIAYGLSMIYSVFLWRKGLRRDDRINYGILLAGLGLHTYAMALRGASLQHCPVNNIYEAMSFVIWTIVAVYAIVGLFPRFRFLGVFASPIVFATGIFALMPGLDPVYKDKPVFNGDLSSVHGALSLLSYGAFGLGCIAGIMYLTQEHDLKFNKFRAVFSLMPPIDRLEKIMNRLLIIGFLLFTLGVATGPFLVKQRYNTWFTFDVKSIWSVVVWVLYLVLLLSHSRFAQTGRRFAWGAVGTFIFVLLTFWGVNLLSPAHQF